MTEQQSRGRCPLYEQAVPLYQQAADADRARLWETLRERFGQIAPVWLESGLAAWLVLGYEENLEVLRDWSTFSRDTRRWNEVREGRRELTEQGRPFMGYRAISLYADGADHARLIAPVNYALSRLSDPQVRADVSEVADRLIDDFCASGSADLVAEYAALLPAMLMNRLFGLEDTYGYVLGELSTMLWSDDSAEASEALIQMRNYFGGLVRHKRETPGNDLTSWMMRHSPDMTDQGVGDQLVLLSGAAHMPTSNLIGNVLRTLLVEREVAREYVGGGLLLEEVVNHVIWTEPPVSSLPARFPTRDVTIAGTRVAEGEPLIIGFAAAHHDPRLGGHPDTPGTPLPSGHNNAHLMWGAGEHKCPAQGVAEGIVHIGVERLLDRLSGLRLAVAPDELRWQPELYSRALVTLPVEFDPVRPPERPVSEPVPSAAGNEGAPAGQEHQSQLNELLSRALEWWRGRGRRQRR